jgi:hypothetical protein
MIKINQDKLSKLETLDLDQGEHGEFANGHCAMELVSWLANEPFSDEPQCACPVIRAFVVRWNDTLPDNESRNRLIRPLVPRIVGTRSTQDVETRRAYLATDWLVRVCAPAWLDITLALRTHAEALRALPEICDPASAEFGAQAIRAAASEAAAAGDAAWDAAGDAAGAAARAAARAAAGAAAWDAAGDAAGYAAWDAARAAARDAAGAAARDAAWAAARDAAWDALRPTVERLQESAQRLLTAMIEVQPFTTPTVTDEQLEAVVGAQ